MIRPPEYSFERSDCAVRAIAFALDMPYGQVHQLMEKHGRKPAHFSPWCAVFETMRELGYPMGWCPMLGGEYVAQPRVTVRNALRVLPRHAFGLAHTSRHLVGYRLATLSEVSARRIQTLWYWRIEA